MKINAKLRKSINILSRIIFAGLALWFIYRQTSGGNNFNQFADNLNILFADNYKKLLFALVALLMPVNWGIESLKWRLLISHIEKVSFFDAYRSVMTGITMSLFTPNRVGEFFGRAFTLRSGETIKGALLTIAGSISQLLVTLIAGFVALIFYLPIYILQDISWQKWLYAGLAVFLVAFSAMLIALYLKVPFLTEQFEKMVRPSWRKINSYLQAIDHLSQKELIRVLIFSLLRYFVFSLQFFVLLRIFGVSIPYLNALMLIAMTYFVMSAIPTVALADLGIRGSVSIYFLGMYFAGNNYSTEILAASTAVWMINLALPALSGILFIHRLKIFRKSKSG